MKRNQKWSLTPFGLEVKKKLLEHNYTMSDLAQELGANKSYISQVLYGYRTGEKYIDRIKAFLDMDGYVHKQ